MPSPAGNYRWQGSTTRASVERGIGLDNLEARVAVVVFLTRDRDRGDEPQALLVPLQCLTIAADVVSRWSMSKAVGEIGLCSVCVRSAGSRVGFS